MSDQILSLKTNDGELISGKFVQTKKEHGRDIHILIVDDIERHVPVMQCMWWAFGEKSVQEVEEERHRLMKEYAKKLIRQHAPAPVEYKDEEYYDDEYDDEEIELTEEQLEDIARGRKAAKDLNNSQVQELIRNLARHQRGLARGTLNDRIIQPGEEFQPKRKRRHVAPSIQRLPDDTPEV